MPDQNNEQEPDVRGLKRALQDIRGSERLALWMKMYEKQCEQPDHQEWMKNCVPYIKLHSWSMDDPKHPKCTFTYTVIEENQNSMGNMHGGCTATLFDFCTSMPVCLINTPDFWWYMGVSRTLNVTYLKPIPVGEEIFIECEIMSIGRTLSTIRGVMRRQSDGVVLATCEHGKYNSDPPTKSKI